MFSHLLAGKVFWGIVHSVALCSANRGLFFWGFQHMTELLVCCAAPGFLSVCNLVASKGGFPGKPWAMVMRHRCTRVSAAGPQQGVRDPEYLRTLVHFDMITHEQIHEHNITFCVCSKTDLCRLGSEQKGRADKQKVGKIVRKMVLKTKKTYS